ncbi:MAG TPA: beta-ketoacyl-[acyl-carrier-protein] synthase family protein [Nitrospirae bacterium]|nr:3-oxoacyl-[acyl-carrier-protein] synthase 2 [bacterium BMS3Abin08]HDO36020.1 beta-ketoacyl-[acyl-carrier-protein] synthase family protein [Nitrospirota bacterium]
MDRGIVITGIGVISPIGMGREPFWDALHKGTTGFREISLFDTSSYNVHTAGEISDFDPVVFLGKKGLRTLDRSTRLICSAAKLAIDDAGLTINDENTHLMGVSVGATFGSLHSISQFDREGLIEGPRYVNPSFFPNTVINSPASQVSIRFKIKGFNSTISTGFCASIDSLIYASDFIRLGRAETVLSGGVEELCEETYMLFHNLGYLSGMDGTEPVCSPFDAYRNGTILGEGAAILILESKEHALKRGAHIFAKVSGYANSFDPSADKDYGSGKGLINAIKLSLKDASKDVSDIDFICSGANSTRGLDLMETAAIKAVFGELAYSVPISAVKSMLGETFSASGSMALSAAVASLNEDFLPPTVNYGERDPACDLDYIPNTPREKRVNTVIVLSSDPYGNNSAVILERW